MNLVPTGDYESEEEEDEEDGDATVVEDVFTESDVDNLFKAFEDASLRGGSAGDGNGNGNASNESVSQFMSSFDIRDSTGGVSVRNNPRTSVHSVLEPSLVSPLSKRELVFSAFRQPQPLLTSSSRSGLDFFMMQTGFRCPNDIFERLLQLDQLRAEKSKGNVLMVDFSFSLTSSHCLCLCLSLSLCLCHCVW
jgi:hypothetical protein